MIAPTDAGRKGRFVNTSSAVRIGRVPAESRVTGSLGESYCCPTSANRLPCPVEISDSALTRSFRFRIPQPPAPRGRRDRVYRRGGLPPETGPTKVGPFLFWALASRRRNHLPAKLQLRTGPRPRTAACRELNLPDG